MSEEQRLADNRRKDIDQFNDHQKDNRNRATQLVNYAFILAGGSFTASISVFASRPKELITTHIAYLLHSGLYYLFISMVSFFGMLAIMVIRDYCLAELLWRPKIHNKEPYLKDKKSSYLFFTLDAVMIISGLVGFFSLAYGLYQIMRAACALVS